MCILPREDYTHEEYTGASQQRLRLTHFYPGLGLWMSCYHCYLICYRGLISEGKNFFAEDWGQGQSQEEGEKALAMSVSDFVVLRQASSS